MPSAEDVLLNQVVATALLLMNGEEWNRFHHRNLCPPFHFCSSDSVSSASRSSGPDEMDTWGTAPVPSTAFDELDAWGAASDGDTVSTTQTKNAQTNLVQQSSDPCGMAALWDEDQHFC